MRVNKKINPRAADEGSIRGLIKAARRDHRWLRSNLGIGPEDGQEKEMPTNGRWALLPKGKTYNPRRSECITRHARASIVNHGLPIAPMTSMS